jgi:hypothetical protein
MFADDLQDEVVPKMAALAFPAEGLFMRLDACSAKDGVRMVPGRASLHSADEILLQLLTSTRVRNVLYCAWRTSDRLRCSSCRLMAA